MHLPKCLKSKNTSNTNTHNHHTSSNSSNTGSGGEKTGSTTTTTQGVCKSLKKSFNNKVTLPHKSSFRSKSDNCLHKIHQNHNNNHHFNNQAGHQQVISDEENCIIKKSFSQRVAHAFASLVLNSNNNVENTTAAISENSNAIRNRQESFENPDDILLNSDTYKNLEDLRTKVDLATSAAIVKSTSLERNINCRITEAEEQARRTRSLERNHRHLVNIDSTCR